MKFEEIVTPSFRFRPFAAMLALTLVLFATTIPAAAACCVGKSNARTAAMHASMQCCGESCRLTSSNTSSDHDVNVLQTPSPMKPLPVATATAATTPPATTSFETGDPSTLASASSPPSFLVHHQFRV